MRTRRTSDLYRWAHAIARHPSGIWLWRHCATPYDRPSPHRAEVFWGKARQPGVHLAYSPALTYLMDFPDTIITDRDVSAWIQDPSNVRQLLLQAGCEVSDVTATDKSLPPSQNYPQLSHMEVELRRIDYSRRWVREDPVLQLPPGTSRQLESIQTIGLSRTRMS